MTPDKLKEIRKSLGYANQKDFADQIGVTRDTIASWETGRNEIPHWLFNMVFLMQTKAQFKEKHLSDSTLKAVVIALQEALRNSEELANGLVALRKDVGMPRESKIDVNFYNSPANILYRKNLNIINIVKDILKDVWWKVDVKSEII